MPRVAKETNRESLELSPQQMFEAAVAAGNIHIPCPVVVTGINRKANIAGAYENVDVFMAVTLPVFVIPNDYDNYERFEEAVRRAAKEGFLQASRETGERYQMIKDLQADGRNKK